MDGSKRSEAEPEDSTVDLEAQRDELLATIAGAMTPAMRKVIEQSISSLEKDPEWELATTVGGTGSAKSG